MDEQPVKSTYKRYGEVTVLAEEGNLTQIDAGGGNIFWVHTAELKMKKAPRATTEQLKGVGYAAPANDNMAMFISTLKVLGFKLEVYARPEEVERVQNEYSTWTNGETLPESAIKIYPNLATAREWRLTFPVAAEPLATFPVVEGGQVRKLHAMGHGEPVGLRQGKQVSVYYPAIIEPLVSAGLRV
jgi:hypothetical protein